MSAGTLLRRGLEMGHDHMQQNPQNFPKLPVWGWLMLGITTLLFGLCSYAIEYTYGHLIMTLVMVESPEAIVFEPLASNDTDASINKPTDPELLLAQSRPITSKFRTTIKHLHAKGGYFARFRGLSMFIVWSILFQLVAGALGAAVPVILGPMVADVLTAQLSLAWTHIVISDPSPKPWYQRIPSYRLWKKVAAPTAILSLAQQLALAVPIYLAVRFGYVRMPDYDDSSAKVSLQVVKACSIIFASVVLGLTVVIPAKVILTRIQASLLPDELESIVPFDRSFGGMVVPEIVGGTGMISMRGAWQSFDWNARVRLVKAYVKVFAMQFAVILAGTLILVGEMGLIVGKDFKKSAPV